MSASGNRTEKQIIGQGGEDRALRHLERHGLVLVERNFRCKVGEIDLVMREGTSLVFVEVRRRADRSRGGAAASIGWSKQQRVMRAAAFYLQRFRQPPPCRIDVVAIDGDALDWLRNAITA